VITVTSDGHCAARLDLADPNPERGWDSWRAYANSKLANILFTPELARRPAGTGVTANCAHPGWYGRGSARPPGPLPRLGITIARPFMASPERGADTIVYLVSSPDVAATSRLATTLRYGSCSSLVRHEAYCYIACKAGRDERRLSLDLMPNRNPKG